MLLHKLYIALDLLEVFLLALSERSVGPTCLIIDKSKFHIIGPLHLRCGDEDLALSALDDLHELISLISLLGSTNMLMMVLPESFLEGISHFKDELVEPRLDLGLDDDLLD